MIPVAAGAGAVALEGVLIAEAAVPGIGWVALGLTVVAIGAYAIVQANSSADTLSPDKPGVIAKCPAGPVAVPCFKPPDPENPEEFDRQLKEQEDALNDMPPDEVLKNIEKFEEEGRAADDTAARQKARARAEANKRRQLDEKYRGRPDAQKLVRKETAQYMKTVDATHAPDSKVGGKRVTGVGGRSENRSIGSQWSKNATGDTKTRGEHVKDAAKDAKKSGQKKMNIKLKRC